MKYRNFFPIVTAVVFLVLASLACGGGQPPEPTSVPPTNPPPVPPTEESLPPTEEPSPVPDVPTPEPVDDEFSQLLVEFEEKGYITTTEGEVFDLEPFKEEWAQLNYYQWWPYDLTASDLLFKGHFNWSSAGSTSDISGCGVLFGLQDNDDHYGVFLDKSRIAFLMSRGSNVYEVGKTRGSGRTEFGNPAEADFILAVKGKTAYVSVDGEVTEYTLSQDQSTQGNFALTLLSGTNRDYGTRCEMTDMALFIPQ